VQRVITQGPVDTFTAFSFQMNDLQENGAFLIMWAEYRIKLVEVFFRPMFRNNDVALDAGQILIPQIVVVFEPSANAAPSVMVEYERFQGAVICDDSRAFGVVASPRMAQPVYDGIITSAYAIGSNKTWLQTAQNSIPHYGIYVAVSGSGNIAGPFQAWNVQVRYTIDFRLVR
jgi:hypothetical protein